jgi:hypothetical protein
VDVAVARLGEELLQLFVEEAEIDASVRGLKFLQELEEGKYVGELLGVEEDISAERTPGAFDVDGKCRRAESRERRRKREPRTLEKSLAFRAEMSRVLGDERSDGGVRSDSGLCFARFAGEGEEIGERQAAPRSAQDGEPCDAVCGMQQSSGECESVLHFRAPVERVKVEGAKRDFGLAGVGLEFFYDGGEMAARAGEDGNTRSLSGKMLLDDAADGNSFLPFVVVFWRLGGLNGGIENLFADDRGVPMDATSSGFANSGGFDKWNVDRIAAVERDSAGGRKDAVEGLVEIFDERLLRAEVGGEAQWGEGDVTEARFVKGAQKTFDTRLSEEIDGLLGVADEEEGLRVAIPGLSEELDEVVLSGGGVLHLVNEQMAEPPAGG